MAAPDRTCRCGDLLPTVAFGLPDKLPDGLVWITNDEDPTFARAGSEARRYLPHLDAIVSVDSPSGWTRLERRVCCVIFDTTR